jgi:hypothetical protein
MVFQSRNHRPKGAFGVVDEVVFLKVEREGFIFKPLGRIK